MKFYFLLAFGIIVLHFIADFVLQTDAQAKAKSKSNNALLAHTGIYSLFFLVAGLFCGGIIFAGKFALITFLAHTVTDYFTSRLNSWLWAKGDVHNFFVSVGFDQVLHYAQLLLTFYYLNQ
jgi:hypothetical protein